EQCRKPVIAAIHGHCLGAGLDMVTACEIRLCSRDAVFAIKEAAVGFVADVGVLQRLPLIVGQGLAREMAYTAGTIDAGRAREILLVNQVLEDREALYQRAEALAAEIAANAPLAVQASKEVLNFGVGKTIDEGLRYVASLSANIVPSEDLFEAFTAFMEKRPARFKGR
nr:enoyl-CoA hydratase/isomerase family protein [Desulfobacterales bacterium]